MTLDLNKLKEVAYCMGSEEYMWDKEDAIGTLYYEGSPYVKVFVKTFSPTVIKELIARIEELEKENSFLKSVLQVNNITW